jgi:hypothetical protein
MLTGEVVGSLGTADPLLQPQAHITANAKCQLANGSVDMVHTVPCITGQSRLRLIPPPSNLCHSTRQLNHSHGRWSRLASCLPLQRVPDSTSLPLSPCCHPHQHLSSPTHSPCTSFVMRSQTPCASNPPFPRPPPKLHCMTKAPSLCKTPSNHPFSLLAGSSFAPWTRATI